MFPQVLVRLPTFHNLLQKNKLIHKWKLKTLRQGKNLIMILIRIIGIRFN